jgi:hypothetical protein
MGGVDSVEKADGMAEASMGTKASADSRFKAAAFRAADFTAAATPSTVAADSTVEAGFMVVAAFTAEAASMEAAGVASH